MADPSIAATTIPSLAELREQIDAMVDPLMFFLAFGMENAKEIGVAQGMADVLAKRASALEAWQAEALKTMTGLYRCIEQIQARLDALEGRGDDGDDSTDLPDDPRPRGPRAALRRALAMMAN